MSDPTSSPSTQTEQVLERVARAIGRSLGYTPEEMDDPENAHMWQDRLAEAGAALIEVSDWFEEEAERATAVGQLDYAGTLQGWVEHFRYEAHRG